MDFLQLSNARLSMRVVSLSESNLKPGQQITSVSLMICPNVQFVKDKKLSALKNEVIVRA